MPHHLTSSFAPTIITTAIPVCHLLTINVNMDHNKQIAKPTRSHFFWYWQAARYQVTKVVIRQNSTNMQPLLDYEMTWQDLYQPVERVSCYFKPILSISSFLWTPRCMPLSGASTWRAWPASLSGGCGCWLGCCCRCFPPGPCVSSPSSEQPLYWLSSSGGSISEAWLPACVYVCALGAPEPTNSSQLLQSLMERGALECN